MARAAAQRTDMRALRGQAMVEFIVIAASLLLLILGTIQFATIYPAKFALNYSSFETARAASVNDARLRAMKLAVARAMAPTYTTPNVSETGGSFPSKFQLGELDGHSRDLQWSNVKCARPHVREWLAQGKDCALMACV